MLACIFIIGIARALPDSVLPLSRATIPLRVNWTLIVWEPIASNHKIKHPLNMTTTDRYIYPSSVESEIIHIVTICQ